MYLNNQKEIVRSMGNWLGGMPWDIFSTITYRYDVKAKQNYRVMTDLERHLMTLDKPFNMFWVTEYTNYNYNTHNHLLVKGDIIGDINYHLKSKSLIGDQVKHLSYEKSASMYVSKFICDEKTNYNLIKNS
ncbi:MAG: hypothetical protein CMD14_00470 [Flavobacteriales bacterium]|nr:hypothetical protein [Flavobacteriales bacterium]|tara:strand:+ start:552 stop:944 length:393 start_codon:yes stop_codon:yes gene_type:complete